MNRIAEILQNSRKIVVKIGSNVLANDEGAVNKAIVANIVGQVSDLIDDGHQVIVVSSGAGICGVGAIQKWHRRRDLNYKQALCAIGQVELMMAYKEYFGQRGWHVGQILLTQDDFTDDDRLLHIRNTLFTLIDEGVVPIVNENDSVSTLDMKIGDNDRLSALTANLWSADALVCLSDIDGVFDKDPKTHKDATLIEEVSDIDALLATIDTSGKSSFGTGGIDTKIDAARTVGKMLVPTVLLNGKRENILREAVAGTARGTAFVWE